MAEQFEEQLSAASVDESDSLIAGKDITFYWKASRLFIFTLVVLEIVNIVINRVPFGMWIIIALVAVLFTWWLLKRFRVKFIAALTANALLGLCAGLLVSVFEIIWYRHWWYALNLIRWPIAFGVAAMAVAAIFYIVFRSIITKNTIKEPKGGGMYGGTKI